MTALGNRSEHEQIRRLTDELARRDAESRRLCDELLEARNIIAATIPAEKKQSKTAFCMLQKNETLLERLINMTAAETQALADVTQLATLAKSLNDQNIAKDKQIADLQAQIAGMPTDTTVQQIDKVATDTLTAINPPTTSVVGGAGTDTTVAAAGADQQAAAQQIPPVQQ